jgi:hypothetical protein
MLWTNLKNWINRNPLFWDYCKTHSFQYHMECQCSDNSQLFISWLFLLDSQSITFTTYNKNKALESQLSGNSDFEKLKASEGWYIVSEKNKSLYFSDLRFGLLNDNPENPQFAFSYEFMQLNRIKSSWSSKSKGTESVYFFSKPIKRKLVDLLILYLCK